MNKQKTEPPIPEVGTPANALDARPYMNSASTPRRGLDPELQAMAKIDRILADFSDDAIARILGWLLDKNQYPPMDRPIEISK